MKTIEFKKLLKEKEPKEIIYMHTMWKINLTGSQLDQCIKLKRLKSGN